MRVNFVYEGHRDDQDKVKVTEPKRQNSYSRNVKL